VVTTERLRSWRRPEIFLVFVFAAVVTPSQDPFTMLALGLPMVLLYEVALIVGWINDRRKARRGDTSPYADLGDDETSPLDFDEAPRPRAGDAGRSAGVPTDAGPVGPVGAGTASTSLGVDQGDIT
jgi:sec-independent protein translocase protein TatC